MNKAIEQLLVCIANAIEKYNNKDTSPSLLAHNIVWFTNCGWVEQITAFKQIDIYR